MDSVRIPGNDREAGRSWPRRIVDQGHKGPNGGIGNDGHREDVGGAAATSGLVAILGVIALSTTIAADAAGGHHDNGDRGAPSTVWLLTSATAPS